MKRTSVFSMLLALAASVQSYGATVIHYNFEDGTASTAMNATGDSSRFGSADLSGNGYNFLAWDANAGPKFSAEGDTATGAGLSAYFTGGQDGYNTAISNWGPQAWTIELSFKYTTVAAFKTLIGKDGTAGLSDAGLSAFYLQTDGDNGNAIRLQYVTKSNEKFNLLTSLVPTANQWYHLVVRSDGRYLDIFVDTLDNTGFNSIGSWDLDTVSPSLGDVDHSFKVTGNWTFGRGWYNKSEDFMSGNIDDIRFSDTALDKTDFLQYKAVYSPTPEEGAILVDTNSDLSWQQDSGTVAQFYRVYISNDPNVYGTEPNSFEDAQYTQMTTPELSLDKLEYNQLYKWRVDTYTSATSVIPGPIWSFTTAPDAVVFAKQPVSTVANPSASFSVTASGAVRYEWFKDGSSTVLSNESTLNISSATLADEGFYYCIAYNGPTAATTSSTLTSDKAYLWTARKMGHWTFDGHMNDSVGLYVTGAPGHDGSIGINSSTTANVGDNVLGYDDGIAGQAIAFTNDDDFVAIDDAQFFNFYPYGFTASLWYKYNGTTNPGWRLPMSKLGAEGWLFGVDHAARKESVFIVENGAGWLHADSSVNVGDGQWHLLTVTYDPATKALVNYVDGLASNTQTFNISSRPLSTAPVSIGGRDPENSVSALIDEVVMYSYPLTQHEIIDELYYPLSGEGVCISPIADGLDLVADCKIDLKDLAKLAAAWLDCGRYPESSCN
ncbi:MAG: hypothetical protein JW745_09160 [Sedimentisphaerales bacterium]|nr:hypothetical protein [Sedimentisphaerales bacterium]MBN2842055.1 hypothetical protein [Sedimentisphaerales bacterium]